MLRRFARFAPLAILAACLSSGAVRPLVAPSRSLAPAALDARPGASAPFAVVVAGPQGKTVDPSEVTLVFNRPMRPLETVGQETAPPASIFAKGAAAPPPGEWHWLGTSALVFSPAGHLPRATAFDVVVPALTRALDGSTLAAPFTFSFETPRPRVVSVRPRDPERLVPGQTFALGFNQPVDLAEVERTMTIAFGRRIDQPDKPSRLEPAGEVRVHATHPKPEYPSWIDVTPVTPLPLDSGIQLRFARSFRGLEGPLPLDLEGSPMATGTFRTYGPLTVTSITCWHPEHDPLCRAGSDVTVSLSNRVKRKDLWRLVRLDGVSAGDLLRRTRGSPDDTDDETGDLLTGSFSFPAALRPASRAVVTVHAGLVDEHGQKLPGDVSVTLDTAHVGSSVSIGLSGETLEAVPGAPGHHPPARIPLYSVNETRYELLTAPLDERQAAALRVLRDLGDGSEDYAAREAAFFASALSQVRDGKQWVLPPATPDREQAHPVALRDLMNGVGQTGARLLAVRGKSQPDVRVLSVTDLALLAKTSRFGDLFWVTRLSTGAPVLGARVTLRDAAGRDLATCTTSADGLATLPDDPGGPAQDGWRDDHRVLFVRKGDDWTLHPMWEPANATAGEYGRVLDGGRLHDAAVFVERGVYRAGETAHAKGFFRSRLAQGTATPAGEKVSVVAKVGSREILQAPVTLDAYGAFAIDVPIPPDAAREGLLVTAHLGDDDGGASAYARVADYKPAEYVAHARIPEEAPHVLGAPLPFIVQGDYLFGAPMTSAKVEWFFVHAPTDFVPPGTDGLRCDDNAYRRALPTERWQPLPDRVHPWEPTNEETFRGEGTLDAHGSLRASLATRWPEAHTPQKLTLEANVSDPSHERIATKAEAIVHPGSFYLALKPPSEPFARRGTTLHPLVGAVSPLGVRRAGVHVSLTLLRSSRGAPGHAVYTPRGSCDLVTAAGTALVGCDLTLPDFGRYVVRATAKDEGGREMASSFEAYAVGGPPEALGARETEAAVTLTPDKASYEIGDVALVALESPWADVDALVTIERTGIYHVERVHLSSASHMIRVPITEALWPNVAVGVDVVRGRRGDAPAPGADDAGRPSFGAAWAALSIDRRSHTLSVEVKPDQRDHRPGDPVDVDVFVKDRAAKPTGGSVTLWAVDEGTLMVTGYETPAPAPAFAGDRPLAVLGVDTHADLAFVLGPESSGIGHGNGQGFGDGHGHGGADTRQDFRPTVFFEAKLVAGADGHVHHRFTLPDGLTTYRIMAVAATTADRFGSGEAFVITKQPLLLRASLPAFVRAGDALQARVLVTSTAAAPVTATVTLDVLGVKVTSPAASRRVTIAPGETVEVAFPVEASAAGTATFTFTGTAGLAHDTLKVTREISVPTVMEAVTLSGATTSAVAEQLGDLKGLRTDVGGLEVHLASSALVGLGAGVSQLLDYPYGCTEQLASRLVPLVPLRSLARDFDLPLPPDVDARIQETVTKLAANQLGDGTFGYWPHSSSGDPWVTAYALWALVLARDAGHAVLPGVITRAEEAVRNDVASTTLNARSAGATRAFGLDVLAVAGHPEPEGMRALYKERSSLPRFARALLAHAMVTTSTDAPLAPVLLADLEAHLRVTATGATVATPVSSDYEALLDSDTRTTAIAIRALLVADRASPLASRLVRGLLDARRGGTWRTTQETAWALLALADYRAAQESAPPDFDALLFHGDALLTRAGFHGRTTRQVTTSLTSAELLSAANAPFTFSVEGQGSLFYEARLRYAMQGMPALAVDRGFTLKKVMRPITMGTLGAALRKVPDQGATSVQAGDLVLVDLLVSTASPHEQVVIDDALPAGLQAVHTDFATTASWLDAAAIGSRLDRRIYDGDVRMGAPPPEPPYRREVRDDRVLTFLDHLPAGVFHFRYMATAVTVGRFVAPPSKVECMYEPETFGRTAGGVLEVVGATAP